jgi:hypothetical protein
MILYQMNWIIFEESKKVIKKNEIGNFVKDYYTKERDNKR